MSKLATQEALDLLQVMHKIMIPLLEQISKRSRVLLIPLSRPKNVIERFAKIKQKPYTDAFCDWNEMTFFYELGVYRNKQTLISKDPHRVPAKAASSMQKGDSSKIYPKLDVSNKRETNADAKQRDTDHSKTNFRDHLRPFTTTSSGIWWWDTSLPLQLSERKECEQIERELTKAHSLYESKELGCFDAIHVGRISRRDMVTMILNLICNSVLGLNDQYCCH
ncbi:hypothetical protein SK128_002976 [Halocaridina rubra]|uniref:Uncharacterized protein n=1 Tax=Halocaridina rubra TaxID=373956 RepID=A0AAN8ZXT4_HALRR